VLQIESEQESEQEPEMAPVEESEEELAFSPLKANLVEEQFVA